MTIPIGLLSRLGLLLTAAAFVLSWSSGFLAAKAVTVDAAVPTVLLWRFLPLAVALVLLVVVLAARERRRDDSTSRGPGIRALSRQAAIGVFSQVGYILPIYAAIDLGIASGTTALIDAVQPLVMAALVGPLLGQRVRGAQWAGLLAGSAGVALVVGSQAVSATAPAWAYALPAVAMASLVAGTFLQQRGRAPMPPLLALTVHVSVAAVAFGALALATDTAAPPASAGFWAAALFLAAAPTLAAYLLYWSLLARIGITALGALLFLVAPVTALGGALLFGEPFGIGTALGFALCAAGVAAVLRPAASGREALAGTAASGCREERVRFGRGDRDQRCHPAAPGGGYPPGTTQDRATGPLRRRIGGVARRHPPTA
ncbi:DMT family transporter [Microbacterium sp. 18062]|uniref:DMT family transporter n=1 Tax=Microbacterium sp. 18062 TaxID=2681410 RepID=UPI0013587D2D|nr:DMT family transporter [Microbacterium sp. 18062]